MLLVEQRELLTHILFSLAKGVSDGTSHNDSKAKSLGHSKAHTEGEKQG